MEDKSKILIAKLILKITFIMIIISVSLKLLGFNYFEADYNNQILLTLSNILDKLKGKPFFNIILLFTQTYIILRLACKNKHIKLYYFASFSTSIICIWGQVLIYDYFWINNPTMASIIYSIFSFLILIGTPVIIDIKSAYESTTQSKNYLIKLINNVWVRIKKPLLIFFMIMIYQVIVLFLRNLTPNERYDTVYNSLLNFDYIILLLVTYYLFLKKEGHLTINDQFEFTLAKLLNRKPDKAEVKYILEDWQDKYQDFKKQNKTEKLVFILYILLFIIQECLTLGIIFFIANLNNYIIECIFILSAFLIAKQTFGAFHFKSFILCFFISNTTFFVLSKLTMKVSSTFVIPIMCGILLSYVASRFIKKKETIPYRGMPIDDLTQLCTNKGLNKLEVGILIDYYCHRLNIDKIAFKYNYSDRNIQRIKLKALQKLQV